MDSIPPVRVSLQPCVVFHPSTHCRPPAALLQYASHERYSCQLRTSTAQLRHTTPCSTSCHSDSSHVPVGGMGTAHVHCGESVLTCVIARQSSAAGTTGEPSRK